MISVCIPCYEQSGMGVSYMTELLNSIRIQKGVEFEVVVSDNSRDRKIELVCRMYPDMNLRYYRNNETFGTSNNTNNAISKAAYDLVKIMYSDDVLLDRFALLEFKLALDKKPWAVSWSRAMNKTGSIGHLRKAEWTERIIGGYNTIGMPSVMAMRKNQFTFDPNLTTLLDCEYYWLLKTTYGLPAIIKKPLVAQRYWDGSMSNIAGNNRRKDFEYLKQKHPSLAGRM